MPHDGHGPHRHGQPGHNHRARTTALWEAPTSAPHSHAPGTPGEPDFDLVEASFIEALDDHSDPTSLLRLASVPFSGTLPDGRAAHLLEVRVETSVEVGSVTPGFAGQSCGYHPLPASRVHQHRHLRFRYWTAAGEVALSLAEARALSAA